MAPWLPHDEGRGSVPSRGPGDTRIPVEHDALVANVALWDEVEDPKEPSAIMPGGLLLEAWAVGDARGDGHRVHGDSGGLGRAVGRYSWNPHRGIPPSLCTAEAHGGSCSESRAAALVKSNWYTACCWDGDDLGIPASE